MIAVLDRDGLPIERVRYDAYGNARHSPLGDITGDGTVGPEDSEAIADLLASGLPALGDAGYEVEADFNLDGVLDDTDAATVFEADPTPPLAPGRISAFGNPFGYTGAYFDAATGMYLMRHRHYSPELGRWAQRDPAGYVDGMSLYEYVRSGPVAHTDPFGLHSQDNWYDLPSELRKNREFRRFVEDSKRGLELPKGFQYSRLDLLELAAEYSQSGKVTDNTRTVIRNALLNMKNSAGGLALAALGMYFITDSSAGVLTEPRSPCRRLLEHLERAAAQGESCDTTTIKNLGEQCQEALDDATGRALGSAAASRIHTAFQSYINDLVDACIAHNRQLCREEEDN